VTPFSHVGICQDRISRQEGNSSSDYGGGQQIYGLPSLRMHATCMVVPAACHAHQKMLKLQGKKKSL
jgi:hypothetical protein